MKQIDTSAFKVDPVADANGTYLQGVIAVPYEVLVEHFGEPEIEIDGKVMHLWQFSSLTGEPVCVYDYKFDGSVRGHWHVGAHDQGVAVRFKNWLKLIINDNVYYTGEIP